MIRALIALLVIVALALAPIFLGGYTLNVLMVILFYVLLSVGLDLVSGYCGQFSFATGAFYGIGAYTAAIMTRDLSTPFWFNIPAGAVIAGLFGLLLGIPALRLKGHFLAIVTIAFQTIVYLVVSQWTSFTGGQVGISMSNIGEVSLFGAPLFAISTLRGYYYLTLVVTVIGVFVAWRLVASRLGAEWVAIRDDETLASAVGLDTTRGKLTAFVASAALAGVAGAVTAYSLRGVTPDDYTIWISATVAAMMVIGGRGTFIGPIIGAAFLIVLPEFLGRFAEYKLLTYGVLLVGVITFAPEGLVGRLRGRGA
jgi:branched-chain amino acid transport system permease protein